MHSISESALESYRTKPMPGSISDASYSSTGEMLACSLDSGKLVLIQAVHSTQFAPLNTPSNESFLVKFIGTDLLMHTAGPELHMLDLKKEEYSGLFSFHTSKICSISTSSIFRNTLSVAHDEAYLWDIREKNPHAKLPMRGRAIAKYSPDGKIFMVLFEEKNEMSLFDARSYLAGPYKTKKISACGYSNMHFSPDSFGMVLFQKDGFSIADGFSGDITMHLASDFAAAGCFTQDSRSFIYTTAPSEISMGHIPETKSVPIFSVDKSTPITALHYNPCYEQVAVVHKDLTFLQNSN